MVISDPKVRVIDKGIHMQVGDALHKSNPYSHMKVNCQKRKSTTLNQTIACVVGFSEVHSLYARNLFWESHNRSGSRSILKSGVKHLGFAVFMNTDPLAEVVSVSDEHLKVRARLPAPSQTQVELDGSWRARARPRGQPGPGSVVAQLIYLPTLTVILFPELKIRLSAQ